jgi:O-antigen ligase
MNELVKNLGVIVLLIGVIVLAVPALTGGLTNTILLAGLGIIIIGYIGHILINKRME